MESRSSKNQLQMQPKCKTYGHSILRVLRLVLYVFNLTVENSTLLGEGSLFSFFTSILTISLLVCCRVGCLLMNRSWWQTDKRDSSLNGASPVAAWHLLIAKQFPGWEVWSDVHFSMVTSNPTWYSFSGVEEGALVSMRLLWACVHPVASNCCEPWIPLICCGRVGDPSGTVVNWLWVLVLLGSPLSHTDGVIAVCLTVEADEATFEERGLAWSFLLFSSREGWPKGTLVAATVLACVLTEVVVVELSALEQARSFAPPQGEDWLVGMAPSNKDVVIFEGLGSWVKMDR